RLILKGDGFDDANSYCLTHVTNSETSQGWELLESLNAHGLAGYQDDNGGITGLDGLRVFFGGFAGTAIAFFLNLSELAGDVSSMAIQYRCVSVADLTRMIEHDDLTLGRVVLGISSDVSTAQFFNRHVLDVETNVVAGHSLLQSFVVHFDGLNFSDQCSGCKGNDHTRILPPYTDTVDNMSSDARIIQCTHWIWNYFTIKDTQFVTFRQWIRRHYKKTRGCLYAQCNHCLKLITTQPQSFLHDHLVKEHSNELTEEEKEDERTHWLWDHITIKNTQYVTCNRCGLKLKNKKFFRNIRKHLKYVHG
ncbi:hypothetical protein ALC57_01394, partial [Trachymyrmex cornetzi]